ncbi:MAG: dihydroorotase [Bdellovibrionales bacterium]|nr:dihydroorotase [Bdellovibrionales bacterium]
MSQKIQELEILTPDDWHVHLRDGEALSFTVPATARCFARAIIMPNLVPPVVGVAQAEAYRGRILEHVPADSHFEPLMTLYLTDSITPEEINKAAASSVVHACKLYPAGATTNSQSGVSDLAHLDSVFAVMEDVGLPLLIHGEITEAEVDIFDREKQFIEKHLIPIHKKFPKLKIVLEHITTADAVDFVERTSSSVAATITPQHLLFNRNDMLVGGIKPHLYCLPILKAGRHQKALQMAAISGNPKFFLGTDSAPHARNTKEAPCGCAGCYSAPFAIELYATIFEQLGALDRLEGFASRFGAEFYGLPVNQSKIVLQRSEQTLAEKLPYVDESGIVPLAAGSPLHWKLRS